MEELRTMKKQRSFRIALAAACLAAGASTLLAEDDGGGCGLLPTQSDLKAALISAVTTETSGLNLNMWATIVDRDGNVCAIAYSGNTRGSQWIGSRVISAQKANTAN